MRRRGSGVDVEDAPLVLGCGEGGEVVQREDTKTMARYWASGYTSLPEIARRSRCRGRWSSGVDENDCVEVFRRGEDVSEVQLVEAEPMVAMACLFASRCDEGVSPETCGVAELRRVIPAAWRRLRG